MIPNLVKLTHSKQALHAFHLVDSSLLPAPQMQSKTALYFAWMWDWAIAYFVASTLINSWVDFLAAMVFPYISVAAEMAFVGSADSLVWMMASLVHFSLSFFSLNAGGQTLGMKLFKHVASDAKQSLSWQQAMLYAAGSTVSLMTVGVTTLLLDKLTFTTTYTEAYHHWEFQSVSRVEKNSVDLVAMAEENMPVEEYKHAA